MLHISIDQQIAELVRPLHVGTDRPRQEDQR